MTEIKTQNKNVLTFILILSMFFTQSRSWAYIYFYVVTLFMLIRVGLKLELYLFKDYFLFFILPNIVILLHSFASIAVYHESFYIMRGINNFLYLMACVLFAYCIYILHGRKSVDLFFFSICTYYLCQLFTAFIIAGPSVFLKNIIIPGAVVLTKWLEEHDIGLSLGLVIIYYAFFYKGSKQSKRKKLLWATIIFILCWKRIAIGALVVVLVFRTIYHRGIDKKGRLTFAWGLAGVFICFAFVNLIYNEFLLEWLWNHGINSQGRGSFYSFFKPYYTMSPYFFGRGSGFTAKWLSIYAGTDKNPGGVLAIHSDILRAYIEYGCIGGFLWYLYYLVILPRVTAQKNEKYSEVVFLLIVYSFIVYMTDNTTNYMLFQTLLMLIPLCTWEATSFRSGKKLFFLADEDALCGCRSSFCYLHRMVAHKGIG